MISTSRHQPVSERRRRPRARIAIAVRQVVGDEEFLCQAANINTQGMFLAKVHEALHPTESKCWLEFSLPGSDQLIRIKGELVWQEQHAHYHLMAVRFALIAPSHQRLIERYGRGEPLAAIWPSFLPPN